MTNWYQLGYFYGSQGLPRTVPRPLKRLEAIAYEHGYRNGEKVNHGTA